MSKATTERLTCQSPCINQVVDLRVVLPPGFRDSASLPLIISLHGGGGDCDFLVEQMPLLDGLYEEGSLCPAVIVAFSSGPASWYADAWETFITEELPNWMAERFNTRLDSAGVGVIGGSMGGYGALKVAFKHPERFTAVASLCAAIEPALTRLPDSRRNTFYRTPTEVWGTPLDPARWAADHPPTIAQSQAAQIRASGLDIYIECGDEDYINFQDGSEFLHRILWDHDIRHEYHLVRGADHVGPSVPYRVCEAYSFLSKAFEGRTSINFDQPLTAGESEYVQWVTEGMLVGAPPPQERFEPMSERAPIVHAALWKEPRRVAAADPDLARAYAKLPPISVQE